MPTKLPRLTQVTALPGLRLALVFADGWETTVDLGAFITRFPSLAPLADPALVDAFRVTVVMDARA